eukprot:4213948-Prymnesium_polylepis.3
MLRAHQLPRPPCWCTRKPQRLGTLPPNCTHPLQAAAAAQQRAGRRRAVWWDGAKAHQVCTPR